MLSLWQSPCFIQHVIVFVVNMSVLTTGLNLAWPSPILVKLRNSTESPLDRPITEEEGSWIVSVGFICSIISNPLLGLLLDGIGRKWCVVLTCAPKILVTIMYVFASEVWMLILGRALIGVADSFLFTVVPVYASEIASKEIRGALCTFLQIFASVGIVITLSVGPFTSYTTYSIVLAAINLLTSLPLLFLPESPYYLYSKGRINEAVEVLKLLRGSEQLAKEEIACYALSENESVDKMQLLKDRVVLKSLGVSILVCVASQLVGFNAVSFYLQTILVSTRTNVMPEVASVVIGLIQLLASFCTTLVTEKFKRKHILISSLVGMLIGLVGLGVFFKIRENTQEVSGFMNYLPVMSLILVVYCYSAGMGSLVWVLIAELFDGPARAIGASASMVVTTLFIFLTTKYFATLTLTIGPAATYWLFSGACAVSCLFIHYCVPETKGKTFAEIQAALGAGLNGDEEKT
ncbi:unnamed protein product, partial [Iphiclides podalirius]